MTAAITFAAKDLIFVAGLLAVVYWLRLPRGEKVEAIVLAVVAGLIAIVLAKAAGMVFDDPRPFVSDHVAPLFPYTADNGFPSDHTLLVAVAAMVVLRRSRPWGLAFFGLAIVVGASRVLSHVHHPVDILGSLVFAVVAGLIAYRVVPLVMKRVGTRQTEASRTGS